MEQNFNPGLMLIGLSGTGPRKTIFFGFPMLLSADKKHFHLEHIRDKINLYSSLSFGHAVLLYVLVNDFIRG